MMLTLTGSLEERTCFHDPALTAPASLGHRGKPKTSDAALICIQTASVSAGSSDCGRQIRIQSGQDDLLDAVNLRPRRDLLLRFAFAIPSYLILREGRE